MSFPQAYKLPEVDQSRLHGAFAYQESMNDEGVFEITHMVPLQRATVAQLKQGIAIYQNQVQRSADGLPELQSLLNRRLMQGARDSDPALLEPDDDAFRAKVHEHIGLEAERFAATMNGFDFDAHIDEALAAGRKAYAEIKFENTPGEAFAVLEIDRKSKPLVLALRNRGIGGIDPTTLDWVIECASIVDHSRMVRDVAVQEATVSAFALKLSEPGFELKIKLRRD